MACWPGKRMAEEIDKIKNMTVEERIKKLKELEKKNKDEIKKAQDMLRESEEELEEKEKEKAKIPIPQLKAVDIEGLFSEEEKQIFKAKRFREEKKEEKEELEETVSEEEKKLTPEQIEQVQHQYADKLSLQPVNQLYNKINEIRENISSTGYMSEVQQNEINNIEYALDKKKEAIESGEYNPSEYAANKLVATQNIGDELKKKYKGA